MFLEGKFVNLICPVNYVPICNIHTLNQDINISRSDPQTVNGQRFHSVGFICLLVVYSLKNVNDFSLKAPTYTFKETKPGYCYTGKTNANLDTCICSISFYCLPVPRSDDV